MSAYYNEIDPYAVQWLKNLIAAGLIADGEVDNRSIEEVSPDDLKGFTQCHFFAGIGGWSLAARLAGWADDEPLWTGSCPCQPFSAAGKRGGTSDERHLWPVFFKLIKECRPSAVAGEQVASKLGYEWLTGVRSDLESEGYAVGAVDLCAASVGAPHIRQRMWWVADPGSERVWHERRKRNGAQSSTQRASWERQRGGPDDGDSSGDGGMADPQSPRQQARPSDGMGVNDRSRWNQGQFEGQGGSYRLAHASNGGCARSEPERWEERQEPDRGGSGLGDSTSQRLEGSAQARATPWTAPGSTVYIPCADGKARRIEPSIEPLAHGVPARVGRLRAYGNAIVPQVAAEVLRAWRGNG